MRIISRGSSLPIFTLLSNCNCYIQWWYYTILESGLCVYTFTHPNPWIIISRAENIRSMENNPSSAHFKNTLLWLHRWYSGLNGCIADCYCTPYSRIDSHVGQKILFAKENNYITEHYPESIYKQKRDLFICHSVRELQWSLNIKLHIIIKINWLRISNLYQSKYQWYQW